MRILVVGAGQTGTRVILQLRKNPNLTILTLDARDNPHAVRQGVIEQVDLQESLTPLTLEYVLAKTRPDLILLTTSTEDMGLGRAPGLDFLAESLRKELAALSEVPIIEVARTGQ